MASYYSQNPEERPRRFQHLLAENERWEYADYLYDSRIEDEISLLGDERNDSFDYDYQAYLLQLADESSHTDDELEAIILGDYHGN